MIETRWGRIHRPVPLTLLWQCPFPLTAARDSIVDVRCSISIAVPRSNKISTKKTDERTISQLNELKTPPRAHKCAGVSLIPSVPVTCMRWLRLRWRVCVCARRGRVLPPINSSLSLSLSVRFLSSQHQTASVRPTPGPRPSTRQRLSDSASVIQKRRQDVVIFVIFPSVA